MEKFPEKLESKKEFLYDEGVNEVVDRVEKMLSEKDHVVISISGGVGSKSYNDADVGKTTLSTEICQKIGSLETAAFGVSNINGLKERTDIASFLKQSGHSKFVIVLNADSVLDLPSEDFENLKNYRNNELKEAGEKIDLPLEKIDMRVLVYRPDRIISENERSNADIVIRNENAKNKREDII